MKCPYCTKQSNHVLDSRLTPDSSSIRRRRECISCRKRFTTYERVGVVDLSIIKKDGRRELFDRDKTLKGILRACEKRPIKRERIDKIMDAIEIALRQMNKTEIKSKKVGELVMNHLKSLDDVAYVRFASVYKKFRDTNQFVEVIQRLNEKPLIEVKK